MKGLLLGLSLVLMVTSAWAEPPASSIRPASRPDFSGARAEPQSTGHVVLSSRPASRPDNLVRRNTVRAAGFIPVPAPQPSVQQGRYICSDRRLTGAAIATIPARVAGCGLQGGVKVTAVDGISLSEGATIDCTTARALADWVEKGLKPAVGSRGGGVAQLKIAGHYTCRPRNNQRGEKVSEHGRGRAIDIGAIVLKNGAQLSVLTGWNDKNQGPVLRKAYASACGPFGTTLGPSSNAMHRDHFHFDTARYRSGPYCR
jgi:hypothetical protein